MIKPRQGKRLLTIILFLVVGCDGIVGSRVQHDHCGVCGGNDESCRIIAGIYTRTHHKSGYHQIAKIPKGACHINITEMAHSRNYLVLQYANGSSIVNGERTLQRAGSYPAAGTVFRYSRREGEACPGGCLLAEGPLTQAVHLQLLSFRRNPGIKYMFTVPKDILERVMKEFRPPRNSQTRHAVSHRRHGGNSRRNSSTGSHMRDDHASQSNTNNISVREKPQYVSPYNTNSHQPLQTQARGYGTQDAINRFRQGYASGSSNNGLEIGSNTERAVYSRDPVLVGDDRRTDSVQKPPHQPQTDYQSYNREYRAYRSRARTRYRLRDRNTVQATLDEPKLRISNTIDPINFLWSISGFTECSQTCGGGQQETVIVCMKRNTNVKVTEENCDPAHKPPIQSVICNKIPCAPDWGSHDWLPCSTTCGDGSQTRRIECQQRISANVSFPVSADACDLVLRPMSTRSCNERPCSDWHTANWTKCSVDCGLGERTRTIHCVKVDGSRVPDGECQGTKPPASQSCDQGQCAQGWFHSSWTDECSTSCGAGEHTRTVYCAAEDGSWLLDVKCGSRPRRRKACRENPPCGGSWFEGPWSQCSVTCGSATMQRDVVCMKKLGSDLFAVVDEENCEGKARPMTTQDCPGLPECEPEWYSTKWAKCSQSCGTGVKTRELRCLAPDLAPSSECTPDSRPATRRPCNTQSCDLPQLEEDPGCRDKWAQCNLVVQARLCGYKYYSDQCCSSCAIHHLKHKQKQGDTQTLL